MLTALTLRILGSSKRASHVAEMCAYAWHAAQAVFVPTSRNDNEEQWKRQRLLRMKYLYHFMNGNVLEGFSSSIVYPQIHQTKAAIEANNIADNIAVDDDICMAWSCPSQVFTRMRWSPVEQIITSVNLHDVTITTYEKNINNCTLFLVCQ